MDLVFNTTRRFEKDLRKYRGPDRERGVKKVNDLADLYVADQARFRRQAMQFPAKVFLSGLESSLYSARVSHKERLIFTAEDDPLFNEVVFTLFALTNHGRVGRVLDGIAQSLYQPAQVQSEEGSDDTD